MYTVEKAVVKKEVFCETINDVEKVFSRLDFYCAVYCGLWCRRHSVGYKFIVYNIYNFKKVGDIIDVEDEKGVFYTFDQFWEYRNQFKELINKWQS